MLLSEDTPTTEHHAHTTTKNTTATEKDHAAQTKDPTTTDEGKIYRVTLRAGTLVTLVDAPEIHANDHAASTKGHDHAANTTTKNTTTTEEDHAANTKTNDIEALIGMLE